MFRLSLIACVMMTFVAAALAQAPKLPADLAELPGEIKSLSWQTIDMTAVQPLEHCRALLLLNHTLDDLSANATAEADLMSEYLETNNLGATFANAPTPPAPPSLTYADAERVAVAMLRGPMSSSSYATDLADLGPNVLQSYAEMYEHTCARRWSEFDESRHQVRCMSSFLGHAKKLQDYDAWASGESSRRQAAAEQRAAAAAGANAQQQATADQQKMEAQLRQQQVELMQMKAALAAAHAGGQPSPQAAASTQPSSGNQTLTPAGQPAQAMNGGWVVNSSGDDYDYGYGPYGGYGGYGYSYSVSVTHNNSDANDAKNNNRSAGRYHAANSSWNREPNYNSSARAQTEARMSAFHGARGRR